MQRIRGSSSTGFLPEDEGQISCTTLINNAGKLVTVEKEEKAEVPNSIFASVFSVAVLPKPATM